VVEAREASGTLWTARHALDQGREVLAVPGPVDSDRCRGSNLLLRDGAAPVLDAVQLLEHLGVRPAGRADVASLEADPAGPAGRVLAALRDAPCDEDTLARTLALRPAELAAALLELELSRRIERAGLQIRLRGA